MGVPQIIICKCIHQSIDLTIETHGDLRSREATRQAEKPTSREAEKPPDKLRSREGIKSATPSEQYVDWDFNFKSLS